MIDEIVADTTHWQNLQPPLAPNPDEVLLYKGLLGSLKPVCLLGMTKQLVELCDVAVDLKPVDIGKPTVQADWNDLAGDYGAIIGDGVLNFTGMDFVPKMLSLCQRFICRVFMKKQEGMKYAKLFFTEFPNNDIVILTQPNISIVMWERKS